MTTTQLDSERAAWAARHGITLPAREAKDPRLLRAPLKPPRNVAADGGRPARRELPPLAESGGMVAGEIAARAGLNMRTVRYMMRDGRLPAVRVLVTAKRWRYEVPRDAAERFIAEQRARRRSGREDA